MKKYIGAMVRKSIRVVLVAENDLLEVAGDPDAELARAAAAELPEAPGPVGRRRAVLGNLGLWNRNLKIELWNRYDILTVRFPFNLNMTLIYYKFKILPVQ